MKRYKKIINKKKKNLIKILKNKIKINNKIINIFKNKIKWIIMIMNLTLKNKMIK